MLGKIMLWPFRKLLEKMEADSKLTPPSVNNHLWMGYWFGMVGMGLVDSILGPGTGLAFALGVFLSMLIVSIASRRIYEEQRMWAELKEKFK